MGVEVSHPPASSVALGAAHLAGSCQVGGGTRHLVDALLTSLISRESRMFSRLFFFEPPLVFLLGSSFFTTILTDSSSASRLFNRRGPEPQPPASSAGGKHCLDTRLQSQGLGFPQGSLSVPSSSVSASFSGPLLCPQAGCVHEGRRAHQLQCLGSVCLTREGVTVCLKPQSPALEAGCVLPVTGARGNARF